MIFIDTNALVVLLIGLMDARLLKTHKRTSIYDEKDFQNLVEFIGDFRKLVVLPNIWTEVDNLLNDFGGNQKYIYVEKIKMLINTLNEEVISSIKATECETFFHIGLTDSLVIECAKKCKLLITSDSSLSDYARAYGIKVYDMVKIRNEREYDSHDRRSSYDA